MCLIINCLRASNYTAVAKLCMDQDALHMIVYKLLQCCMHLEELYITLCPKIPTNGKRK
jgi:hypothetical protein